MTIYESSVYQEDLSVAAAHVVSADRLVGKKIMITGASGLVGSMLVDTLLKLNELHQLNIEIFAVGRSLSRLTQRFSVSSDKLHLIEQDVNEPLQLTEKIDVLIHAASNANPQAYSDDPIGTIKGNTQATMALLDYCQSVSAEQFIYISSGEVYGQLPESAVPFTEDMSGYIDPLNVRACYMLSKKMAENICVSYTHQYGLATKIVRLSHVFGANYTERDNRASASFFVEALKGNDIVLKSLGNHLRSYIYVADAVSGILSVLTAGESANAYNVTKTDNAITLANFARTIAESADVDIKFDIEEKIDPSKATPISFAVLSDEKLRAKTWQPVYSVKEGVGQVIKILKNE